MPPLDDIAGDLVNTEDGALEGWCWSRARPGQRLTVELAVNDTILGATVAARFRQDLLDRAIGDGRHGFLLRPYHGLPTAPYVISARVRRPDGPGAPFARVVSGGASLPDDGIQRLAQCEAHLRGIAADLSAAPAMSPSPSAALRNVFAGLAAELEASARAGPATDPELRRAMAGLPRPVVSLAAPPAPGASIVLLAGADPVRTLAAVIAYAPLLRQHLAEMLLIDRGLTATNALIPARVPGLRYVRDTGVRSLCAAINLAIRLGGAKKTVMLHGDAPHPAAVPVGRLLAAAETSPLIAPATTRTPPVSHAILSGIDDSDGLGLLLAGQTDQLAAVGGLDERLFADMPLAWADLCLKAEMLGIQVARLRQQATAASAGYASAHSARLFSTRWGMACA